MNSMSVKPVCVRFMAENGAVPARHPSELQTSGECTKISGLRV